MWSVQEGHMHEMREGGKEMKTGTGVVLMGTQKEGKPSVCPFAGPEGGPNPRRVAEGLSVFRPRPPCAVPGPQVCGRSGG